MHRVWRFWGGGCVRDDSAHVGGLISCHVVLRCRLLACSRLERDEGERERERGDNSGRGVRRMHRVLCFVYYIVSSSAYLSLIDA